MTGGGSRILVRPTVVVACLALLLAGAPTLGTSSGQAALIRAPFRLAAAAVPTGFAAETFATGLAFPTGLAFDSSGNLFVATFGADDSLHLGTTPNGAVFRITPARAMSTIVPAGSLGLANPYGV